MLNFKASTSDSQLIRLIISRAKALFDAMPEAKAAAVGSEHDKVDWLGLEMDITVAHLNGCPLDLRGLHDSANFNLVHDLFGIRRHLDRTTGKLSELFVPRYASSNHTGMEKLP